MVAAPEPLERELTIFFAGSDVDVAAREEETQSPDTGFGVAVAQGRVDFQVNKARCATRAK